MNEVTESQVVTLLGMASAGSPNYEEALFNMAMDKDFCEDFAMLLTALVIANSIP